MKFLCSAYPNPTNEYLILKVDNHYNNNVFYQLFDLNGKLLKNRKVTEPETIIQMGSLKPAVYSLVVYDFGKEDKIINFPDNIIHQNLLFNEYQPGFVKTIKVIKK